MNWAKILGDRAAFPDDVKFTLNGQEVTLGAIRTENDASQGALQQQLTVRQQQLDQREQLQNQATENLARIIENVERQTGLTAQQIISGQIPEHLRASVQQATLNTKTAGGTRLADDPLYAPIVAELVPMRSRIEQTANALGTALGVYKNDRARLDWTEWNVFEKPQGADLKITFDQVVNHAVNRGYNGQDGWPDIKRAANELAAPTVQQAQQAKSKDEWIAEGRRLERADQASRQGQPNFGGGDMLSTAASVEFTTKPDAKTGTSRTKTIAEQLNQAFDDPKMFAAVN